MEDTLSALPPCVWTETCPSEPPDEGTVSTDSVQAKRLQVLNVWRQIQQLEAEIKEMLVCDVTAAATEKSIKAQQVPGDKTFACLSHSSFFINSA